MEAAGWGFSPLGSSSAVFTFLVFSPPVNSPLVPSLPHVLSSSLPHPTHCHCGLPASPNPLTVTVIVNNAFTGAGNPSLAITDYTVKT